MTQEFDAGVNSKVEAAESSLEELIPKMVAAVQETADLGRENGLGKLEASASGLVEATTALKSVFEEMLECCKKFREYNKRIEEAIG